MTGNGYTNTLKKQSGLKLFIVYFSIERTNLEATVFRNNKRSRSRLKRVVLFFFYYTIVKLIMITFTPCIMSKSGYISVRISGPIKLIYYITKAPGLSKFQTKP